MKQTALIEEHRKLGGKLIDFGGWELPVQYTGVMDEHRACRSACGLFDVSHMGEITVEGPDAAKFLDFLVTHHASATTVGQAQYTVMCHDDGGIVDDLVIYRRAQDRFLVVVNASNTDKDYAHFLKIRDLFKGDVRLSNESSHFSQIALQGRQAQKILSQITQTDLSSIGTYKFIEGALLGSTPAIIARTGYTGEDGFELYTEWSKGPEVWRALLEVGASHGLKACGLGARDTLRLEVKYPLYGHELSDTTHPFEAGLGWVVKLDKPADFIGKSALQKIKADGVKRKLVGLKTLERGIPRQDYSIYAGSEVIGRVTSGTQSPSLGYAIAIGYVSTAAAAVGTQVAVDIRNTKVPAEVIPTPFYKRSY